MIFGDSMAIPEMLYAVPVLLQTIRCLLGILIEDSMKLRKKNYLHGHDVGDDVLPKCCIRCHQKSTWFGSFSGSPFSLEFVVGVGVEV
jgi:hypothetical protein